MILPKKYCSASGSAFCLTKCPCCPGPKPSPNSKSHQNIAQIDYSAVIGSYNAISGKFEPIPDKQTISNTHAGIDKRGVPIIGSFDAERPWRMF